MRNLIKFILFLILFINCSKVSYGCDLDLNNLKNLNLNNENSINFIDMFGANITIHPLEEYCEEKSLYGSLIKYTRLDDKLIRITIERGNFDDVNLMSYSFKKYSKVSIYENLRVSPEVNLKNWRGTFYWDAGNELIKYIQSDIPGGKIEVLEIDNLNHIKTIEIYEEKIGKWLDSQK